MNKRDCNTKKEWPRSYGITLPAKPRIQRSCRSSALHYPLLRLKAYFMIPFNSKSVNVQPLRSHCSISAAWLFSFCGQTVQFKTVRVFNLGGIFSQKCKFDDRFPEQPVLVSRLDGLQGEIYKTSAANLLSRRKGTNQSGIRYNKLRKLKEAKK